MATDIKCFDENLTNVQVWKYFKVARFFQLLDTSCLYFSAAKQFEDKFEGSVGIRETRQEFCGEKTLQHAFEELKRLAKINCWHISDYENSAMWSLYAHENKGIAIVSTSDDLVLSLEDYKIEPEYSTETINFGKVSYVDLSEYNQRLSMLERFFYKHNCFQWEQELRFLISLRMAEEFGVRVPDDGIFVRTNLQKMIHKIVLGPNLSPEDNATILEQVEKHGIAHLVQKSTLTYTPTFI